MFLHDECMIDLTIDVHEGDAVLFAFDRVTGDRIFNTLLYKPSVVYAIASDSQKMDDFNTLLAVFATGTFEGLWNTYSQVVTPIGAMVLPLRFLYSKSNLELQRKTWFRYEYVTKAILWVLTRRLVLKRLGVDHRQLDLITHHDKRTLFEYAWTVTNGIFQNICLNENVYYFSALYGRCLKSLCPLVLKEEYFDKFKTECHVIRPAQSLITTLTTIDVKLNRVVLLDHLDRMGKTDVLVVLALLRKSMKIGAVGLLKSVSLYPWFIHEFKQQGFQIVRNASHLTDTVIDSVNVHASCWMFKKLIKDFKSD